MNESRVRLAAGFRYVARDGLQAEQRIYIRVALPALQRRLQLIVDQYAESAPLGHRLAGRHESDDARPIPGLRYILHEEERRRLHLDGRLRYRDGIRPVARLRGVLAVPLDPWDLRLSHAIRYILRDGWEAGAEVRAWRMIRDPAWLHIASELAWTERTPGIQPSQNVTVFIPWRSRHVFRVRIDATWPEWPDADRTLYRTEATLRTPLRREWAFFEIGSGVMFPREEAYRATPFLRMQMEVFFGERYLSME